MGGIHFWPHRFSSGYPSSVCISIFVKALFLNKLGISFKDMPFLLLTLCISTKTVLSPASPSNRLQRLGYLHPAFSASCCPFLLDNLSKKIKKDAPIS